MERPIPAEIHTARTVVEPGVPARGSTRIGEEWVFDIDRLGAELVDEVRLTSSPDPGRAGATTSLPDRDDSNQGGRWPTVVA